MGKVAAWADSAHRWVVAFDRVGAKLKAFVGLCSGLEAEVWGDSEVSPKEQEASEG